MSIIGLRWAHTRIGCSQRGFKYGKVLTASLWSLHLRFLLDLRSFTR